MRRAMAQDFLRLNGITRRDRHEMISRVKEAVLRSGGFVVDFHMFSNVSLCLNFEIAAAKIQRLEVELEATGLQLTEESRRSLAERHERAEQLDEADGASEVAGTIQMTFIHDEPDLRIEVPPIPG